MLIPYFAGSARQMLAQRDHWNTLGADAPFALENVPMHIIKGEAYHDDPDQAIRHLNWFRRHRWPRYQGLGVPVLDYEPATEDGGRSSWRWWNDPEPDWEIVHPWRELLMRFVAKECGGRPPVWYNLRSRAFGKTVTRPVAANETIKPHHLERHAEYTDIWCIDAHQLDYDNLEAFQESRKPVAIWLRDSRCKDVEVTVEVAGAKRKEKA